MSIKNVAIAGATGNVGLAVIAALLDAKTFNVTALTRIGSSSKSKLPSGVTVVEVDYSKHADLVQVFKGQDAVICALAPPALPHQRTIFDAAVAAGVQRFLPSEFGSDAQNPKIAALPFFRAKTTDFQYFESLASQGKITYTNVITGPFLDYGLNRGFMGLDLRQRRVTYYDGGATKFSATTLPTIGRAVAAVLAKPEETKNRTVRIQDVTLTMRELFGLAKQALGSEGWTEVDGGTPEEAKEASDVKLAQSNGEMSMEVVLGYLIAAIFGKGYGGNFQNPDNAMLGIKPFSESEVVEVIKQVAKKQSSS